MDEFSHPGDQTKMLSIDTLKSLVQCVSCKRSNIGVRSLPCWHALCQECLEQALKSFDVGNALICPLCYAKHPAKLFEEGMNFPFSSNFIEKLRNALEFDNMKNVVEVGRLRCQVCESNFQEDMTIPHSAVSESSDWDPRTHACDRLAFCVQCSQNMCKTCANKHTSMSASKSHCVYTYGDHVNIGDWMKSSESNVQKCGKHHGREIVIQCEDCKNTGSQWGCLLCLKEHKSHQGLLVKNIICVEEVRKHLIDDKALYEKIQMILLSRDQKLLEEELRRNKESTQDVDVSEAEKRPDFPEELRILAVYCQAVIEYGTPVELFWMSDCIRRVLKSAFNAMPLSNTRDPQFIALFPSFGGLLEFAKYDPVLSYGKFQIESKIRGLSNVCIKESNSVFIVQQTSSEVTGYGLESSESIKILLKGLRNPWDVLATINRTIFVSEQSENFIWMLASSKKQTMLLLTGCASATLSATCTGNVLVSCSKSQQLVEYDSSGEMVNQIFLGYTNISPSHAVKLSTGDFVVSDITDKQHRVVKLSKVGEIICEYGRSSELITKPVDMPIYLAKSRDDHVLVADQNNSRILLLNHSSEPVKELLSAKHGLEKPFRISLDEIGRRIFVVDQKQPKKVLTFSYNNGSPMFQWLQ